MLGVVLVRSPYARSLAGQGSSWHWVLPSSSTFGLTWARRQRYTTTIHWQLWIPRAGAMCWKTWHGWCLRKQEQTARFRIPFQADALMVAEGGPTKQNMISCWTRGVLKSRARSSNGTLEQGLGMFRSEVWSLERLTICIWLSSDHSGWTLSNMIWRQGFQGLVWQQNAVVTKWLSMVKLSGRIRLKLYTTNCAKLAIPYTWAEKALMSLHAQHSVNATLATLTCSIMKFPWGLWAHN